MMSNYSFRINKYLKVSLAIGIIDLLVFYIINKLFNCSTPFSLIMDNWKYIILFISSMLLIIYFCDVLFFSNRNTKFKILLIRHEPFKNWPQYIDKGITIRSKDKKLDFYSNIYCKVRNKEKIQGIRDDDILIRDIIIHMSFTNLIIIFFLFILEKINLQIYIIRFVFLVIIDVFLNLAYRQYLKYYISEIYREYLNNDK